MAGPRVIDDLARWGPNAIGSAPSQGESEGYCRALARSHYENFPVDSLFLPRRLRQPFFNVYAFCRWADDLGDEVGDSRRSLELLAWWRGELKDCYRGRCRHPVFIALRPTIERFAIPLAPFADLISAFEQDQRVRRYETFAELLGYCRRSADPVGRIVLRLCERYEEANVLLSDAICSGLQLANFWQDVARDFDLGRVYLPREDRERFGYRDEDLLARRTTPEFRRLLAFEVERARALLLTGAPLIDRLPGRLQLVVELFLRGGLAILKAIERGDYGVWEERPVVGKGELIGGVVGGRLAALVGRRRRP